MAQTFRAADCGAALCGGGVYRRRIGAYEIACPAPPCRDQPSLDKPILACPAMI